MLTDRERALAIAIRMRCGYDGPALSTEVLQSLARQELSFDEVLQAVRDDPGLLVMPTSTLKLPRPS